MVVGDDDGFKGRLRFLTISVHCSDKPFNLQKTISHGTQIKGEIVTSSQIILGFLVTHVSESEAYALSMYPFIDIDRMITFSLFYFIFR